VQDVPFIPSQALTSKAGRRGIIGRTLECVKCDRGEPRDAPDDPPGNGFGDAINEGPVR